MTAPTESGKPEKSDAKPAPTPVPPRGGQKKKPNRPTAPRPAAGRPVPKTAAAAAGAGGAKATGSRPATKASTNRRQAEWQARRKRNLTLSAVAVGVVVVVVAVFIVVKTTGGSSSSNQASTVKLGQATGKLTVDAAGISALPASAATVENVPIAALASASKGTTVATLAGGSGHSISNKPPLTANGLPEVLYIGAGFCPFCAAERWPMVAALSKFGTFGNTLGSAASSGSDSNPFTPTFSFYRSTYTSKYITFTAVETTTQDKNVPLQDPSAAQLKLWASLDSGESIPFIDFGNKYRISGATYDSSAMSNKSFDSVAAQVGNNTTAVGKGIDQSAGAMVKAICQMTGDQPATVCSPIGT